jgi:type II secretion system protein G
MCRAKQGFTLVEILIVVIILGILAAIVVPSLSDTTTISRETNLKENLSKIRVHIQVYRNQHGSFPTAADFADQLTKHTNFQGEVADMRDTDHRFGPYLEQMPPNPITNSKVVRAASTSAELLPPGDVDGGWWYNEFTGRFYADLTDSHADRDGVPCNTY